MNHAPTRTTQHRAPAFAKPAWLYPAAVATAACALLHAASTNPVFLYTPWHPHAIASLSASAVITIGLAALAYRARRELPSFRVTTTPREHARIERAGVAGALLGRAALPLREVAEVRLATVRVFGRRRVVAVARDAHHLRSARLTEDHARFGDAVFTIADTAGITVTGQAPAAHTHAEAALTGERTPNLTARGLPYELGLLALLAIPGLALAMLVAGTLAFAVFGGPRGATNTSVWAVPITILVLVAVSRLIVFPVTRRNAAHQKTKPHTGLAAAV